MAEKQSKLTAEAVDSLRQTINPATGRKFTQNDIANLYGVSRQYVSKLKKQNPGHYLSRREAAMKAFPWRVRSEQQGYVFLRLREHLEYLATRGEGMQEWKRLKLRGFYSFLERENLVVEYSPNIPPNKHSKGGGFTYRVRKPSDENLIIRENSHTVLSERDKRFWRFPKTKP